MKKLFWILQIAILSVSLSMCKSTQIIGKEYKTEIKNPYKFDSQIKSRMYRDSLNPEFEYAATLYSLKSDYRKALSIWDSIPGNQQRYQAIDTSFITNGYEIISAKDYIIKESQNNSIVILNEAHHNNSHRVFAESLLPNLYKNGYRLLFLEALTNDEDVDSLLNKRKYPVEASGFYTINSQFGNFIRKALKIGFKIFPYETTRNIDGKIREINQANSIYNTLQKYPKEKALVFVGYGHNREGKVVYWEQTMAERLKVLTGINPLTISQDKFSEKSSKTLSNPLLVELNLKEPSVLINKKYEPYKTKTDSSWTDITVFHPFTEYRNERPNWLFYENKKSVAINFKDVTIDFPIMLMAYNNIDELKNEAIPLDIVEIENHNKSANLVLSKGSYIIKAINKNGFSQNISYLVK